MSTAPAISREAFARQLREMHVPEAVIDRELAQRYPEEEQEPAAAAAGSGRRMNKTEAAFAATLEARRQANEIRRWDYEPMKLRLADRTYYIPDFRVEENDRSLTIYEVKGFWRDDARVKIKVAAELHPCFRFVAVQKVRERDGGGWKYEYIPSPAIVQLTPH